ncbi:NADPH-dependent FMN reductase [Streptomyces profundus]|uniref:NADPH-dependent FMN reductase n=1 Tax=Streptomyces profundus TaxID=2867410 RepID=UPI001D16527E|nr:NAD(P)H-dependent oxidoreductase [Streptomyces sp. MA3_2.13]
MTDDAIVVLGLGGSPRAGSTTERALRVCLEAAEQRGAVTRMIAGEKLNLPLYDPNVALRSDRARYLVRQIAQADGIILATPAYHGTISGLVKNALDYVEDLRGADRPYFTDRAVGCLSVGQGWQGPASALAALRDTAHALRGWPTPLGVTINTEAGVFEADGTFADTSLHNQLRVLGTQVVEFAQMNHALRFAQMTRALRQSAQRERIGTPDSDVRTRLSAGADVQWSAMAAGR